MNERDWPHEKGSHLAYYAEVRRYWRDSKTGLILPEAVELVRLLPNQAVVFGKSLYQPVIISNADPNALVKAVDFLREDYRPINRLNGLAIAHPLTGLLLELPDGQQQSANLSGGHKANAAYLVGSDSAILGVLGKTPDDLKAEFEYRERLFPKKS